MPLDLNLNLGPAAVTYLTQHSRLSSLWFGGESSWWLCSWGPVTASLSLGERRTSYCIF